MSAFEIGLLVCGLIIGWLLAAAGGRRRRVRVLEGEVRRLKSTNDWLMLGVVRQVRRTRETDSPQPPAPPS